MAAPNLPWISVDDFLGQEAHSLTKHTYSSGLVTAMSGGFIPHWKLSAKLIVALSNALKDSPCFVGGTDLLFHPGTGDTLTYPDVMVVCGALVNWENRKNVIINPAFVAEILSPTTEAHDRGFKSREYRATPSIRQYALLSQDAPLIEFHTRAADGRWVITEVAGLDAHCEFSSLGCTIPMAELYNGVLE